MKDNLSKNIKIFDNFMINTYLIVVEGLEDILTIKQSNVALNPLWQLKLIFVILLQNT